MNHEQQYIRKRIWKGRFCSIPFYLCRIFPIKKKKIVFCCIEGTTGYTCNPKYIAEELIRRNAGYELVWLVNDMAKKFPAEIKVVHNTLWNRAYQLSTSRFWVDNSWKYARGEGRFIFRHGMQSWDLNRPAWTEELRFPGLPIW